jgi:zinc dependent phospholipase C
MFFLLAFSRIRNVQTPECRLKAALTQQKPTKAGTQNARQNRKEFRFQCIKEFLTKFNNLIKDFQVGFRVICALIQFSNHQEQIMKSKVNTKGLSRRSSVCGLEAKISARIPAARILRGRMFLISFTRFRLIGSLALILFLAQVSLGYSPLTHEAIIDSTWDDSIKPLLLTRFPTTSDDDLREARAYAYGGCLIQDMGYYPFSSKLFSDLVHYVRSGDFIVALLEVSQDIKEYAFALGALSHYAADNNGHSIAVNQAVPVAYPKLRAKHGDEITYGDDATSHIRVEFAFDVLQVARGHYAPQRYHDSIGFKVAKSMLERAFKNTYGIEMKEIFGSVALAIGTYRRSMSAIIPLATKVAWEIKRGEIKKVVPGITSDRFVFNVSHKSYEKEWGEQYEGGGIVAKTLAIFFRILPKVGPLKPFAYKPLTPETDRMFIMCATIWPSLIIKCRLAQSKRATQVGNILWRRRRYEKVSCYLMPRGVGILIPDRQRKKLFDAGNPGIIRRQTRRCRDVV